MYKGVPADLPVMSAPPKNKNTKKYIMALVVALVLSGAFWGFVKKDSLSNLVNFAKKEEPAVNLPPAPKYTKTDLPTDKLPEILPKDLPMEKDAVILENYQVETKDGKVQGTRKFLSLKSVKENYAVYQKYLENNKWKILELKNEIDSVSIMATKPNVQDKIFADFYVSPNFPKATVVVITFSSVKK